MGRSVGIRGREAKDGQSPFGIDIGTKTDALSIPIPIIRPQPFVARATKG